MPYIAQVAVGKLKELSVFGNDYPTPDGTCIRDYIHVIDLADGHVKALEKLREDPGVVVYNLGTGKGSSVMEMIAAFAEATGIKIPYRITAGGPAMPRWASRPVQSRDSAGRRRGYHRYVPGPVDVAVAEPGWYSVTLIPEA